MLLSAGELKRQLMDDTDFSERNKSLPLEWERKKKDYAEVGQHIKRMIGTNGWKIVETWLLHKLDVNVLIRGTDIDRTRAAAYADLLQQVNSWVVIGERAAEELEPKGD